MPSVTHEVDQVLEVNLESLNEEDRNTVIECHKKPDAYVSDNSFPGEMTCRIDTCLAEESSKMPGLFTLKRKLYFDFSWKDEDAMSDWARAAVATHDPRLPSHVAGNYESLCIGGVMYDYENDNRGVLISVNEAESGVPAASDFKNLNAFLDAVKADANLLSRLSLARDATEVVIIANAAGFPISVDEFDSVPFGSSLWRRIQRAGIGHL